MQRVSDNRLLLVLQATPKHMSPRFYRSRIPNVAEFARIQDSATFLYGVENKINLPLSGKQ